MKKIASALIIMLTIGSTAVFATGTDKGKNAHATEQKVNVSLLPYDNSKGIILTAANVGNEEVNVVIYDAYGETVYSETVSSSPEIHRNYNLAALPNGTYNVSVSSDNYSVTKTIEVR